MTPKIDKILYATDLSENAIFAFGYAADLAEKYDARITVLYVKETMNYAAEKEVSELVGSKKWEELKEQKQEYVTQKLQTRIEDLCEKVSSGNVAYKHLGDDIRIVEGVPHNVILETSRQMGADLIVIGTHGYNLLKDALIGGTARKVIKNSKIPVFVIRLPEE
jgi:nucleotide-binding universal stress UspA family protein